MYERDILDEPVRWAPMSPVVPARLGLVVEDRASGFCGDVVRITTEAVTLRDRVRTYADLDPALVGAVERLIDFVTEPPSPSFM